MLLGGRATRTVTHILNSASQPKPIFIDHITPLRVLAASKVSKRQIRTNEHPVLDANTRESPVPSQTKLSYRSRARLLEFLNQPVPEAHLAGPPKKHPNRRHSQTEHDVASAYLSVRESSPAVWQLRPPAYLRIAQHAEGNQLQQVMDTLAMDLLAHFSRDEDPHGFSEAIVAILSRATSKCPLTHQRMLELYGALTASNPVKPPLLDPDVLHRVLMAMLDRPDAYIPPLESLVPALLSAEAQTEQSNAKSTWITYGLLMKILLEGEESYSHALAVFQQLIEAGRIPKLAQERAEEHGGSFKTIIASALVRGCLVFGWHEKAAELTLELLQDPRWPYVEGATKEEVQATAGLGLEVLQTLIPSSAKGEVRICRRLIRALLPTSTSSPTSPTPPPPVEIPHDILFSFYDACYNRKITDAAASVYLHLQSPRIRAYHDYPPPRHSALFWLFDYFAAPGVPPRVEGRRPTFRGHLPAARNLVKDILHRGHPIPVMDRPRFIAVAAARGFGMYARQLWELYTAENDPDRDAVRGNAQMLVRLISLFRKSQGIWDEAIEEGRCHGTIKGDQSKDAVADLSNAGIERDKAHGAGADAKELLPRDYRRFAERVLSSFIETKQPLAMASQQDLNALARAHLLLEHIPEGLEALTLIMDRGDMPDSKDINVALAGIARYSARRAARMIERMLQRGIQPTASTFGAVLHEALRAKDSELVERLVNRASELGHGALTQKALASLLRSTISFEYTSDKEERIRQQWSVRWAMEAIETVIRYPSNQAGRKDHGKDHVLSVNMGKDCIKAALRAMQPEMAFRFWGTLVKDRVLWNDQESKDMRGWIARSIRYRWRQKHLGYDKASEILDELGEPGVEADGSRVAKPGRPVDISL